MIATVVSANASQDYHFFCGKGIRSSLLASLMFKMPCCPLYHCTVQWVSGTHLLVHTLKDLSPIPPPLPLVTMIPLCLYSWTFLGPIYKWHHVFQNGLGWGLLVSLPNLGAYNRKLLSHVSQLLLWVIKLTFSSSSAWLRIHVDNFFPRYLTSGIYPEKPSLQVRNSICTHYSCCLK